MKGIKVFDIIIKKMLFLNVFILISGLPESILTYGCFNLHFYHCKSDMWGGVLMIFTLFKFF